MFWVAAGPGIFVIHASAVLLPQTYKNKKTK